MENLLIIYFYNIFTAKVCFFHAGTDLPVEDYGEALLNDLLLQGALLDLLGGLLGLGLNVRLTCKVSQKSYK